MAEVDAAVFFGRDAEIVLGLDALRGMRATGVTSLFVVLGPSGAGKSSFLRAGLLPRLRRDDRRFLPRVIEAAFFRALKDADQAVVPASPMGTPGADGTGPVPGVTLNSMGDPVVPSAAPIHHKRKTRAHRRRRRAKTATEAPADAGAAPAPPADNPPPDGPPKTENPDT